jgi:adenylylsulfate kinase-like enzyme
MIIWLTGQPLSGKTTIASLLSESLKCPWIDGDAVRKLVGNRDYSPDGRKANIELIQSMAVTAYKFNKYCVVSAVAPFRSQRDVFKQKHSVIEVYLTSDRKSEAEVPYYEPPLTYFLHLDTSLFTPQSCLDKILDTLTPEY